MHRLTFLTCLLLLPSSALAFHTNGKVWPEMPIKYWVNPAECPEVETDNGTIDIVMVSALATQAWGGVPCATVSFQYMGTTDATWEPDGKNVIYCVSDPEQWAFGPGAAGATLWLPQENEGDPMEVDLALNAAELEWRDGGGSALESDVLDPQALITHELGHWLGLTHTEDPYATMYFATLPGGLQKTLAADDKAGICSIYPSGYDECESDADCDDGWVCKSQQGLPLCHEIHDGPGAFCSKDYINCDAMCWVSYYECAQLCLFTSMNYDEGYCAPLCGEGHPDCPAGFLCSEVPSEGIFVCTEDPDYIPVDTGPDEVEHVEFVEQPSDFEVIAQDVVAEVLAQDSGAETVTDMAPSTDAPGADAGVPDSVAEVISNGPESDKSSGGCNAANRSLGGLSILLFALLALAGMRRETR